jgi:rhamnogalacturonan endolyase
MFGAITAVKWPTVPRLPLSLNPLPAEKAGNAGDAEPVTFLKLGPSEPSVPTNRFCFLLRFLTASIVVAFFSASLDAAEYGVVISADTNSFTLANGVLTARVSKASGDLMSLKYNGLEILDEEKQHPPAYWSQDTSRSRRITRVTIDPATNGGAFGEVSVKGVYVPAAGRFGGFNRGPACDIEIRYALGRSDPALYAYAIFSHPTNYPTTGFGEARFCAKLSDSLFDWMTVDARRNFQMITAYDWNHGTELNFKEARRMNSGQFRGQVEHKYDYTANQFDVRTWGWSSSAAHVGIWFINPSVEYLSGGPTKFELSAHRDATFTDSQVAPAPPTLLNYWRSSHYGGSMCSIAATDAWTKVVGPFLIYCNSGGGHDALWQDALTREKAETAAWPYSWVNGVDYPHKNDRATVIGRIVLRDPQAPGLVMSNLLVGLTAPDYAPPPTPRRPSGIGNYGGFGLGGGGEDDTNNPGGTAVGQNSLENRRTNSTASAVATRFGRGGSSPGPRVVDWQLDAKNYQFWVRGHEDGTFSISNVRAGTYTLHAIADGVLGELAVSNVVITAGQTLTLGSLNWQPVRYGRQLWDIGIPNRQGSEFFKGDDYFHWGWYLAYPKLFPNDVNYVIGQSDFHKDWFFEQVPHDEETDDTDGRGHGRATPWTVSFILPATPHGKAILRLAICGIGARRLDATMNHQSIGSVNNLVYNATINRDGIGGTWCERDLVFDASLMRAGQNTLTLTVPAGGLMSGILYDYLRLELDDNAVVQDPVEP